MLLLVELESLFLCTEFINRFEVGLEGLFLCLRGCLFLLFPYYKGICMVDMENRVVYID